MPVPTVKSVGLALTGLADFLRRKRESRAEVYAKARVCYEFCDIEQEDLVGEEWAERYRLTRARGARKASPACHAVAAARGRAASRQPWASNSRSRRSSRRTTLRRWPAPTACAGLPAARLRPAAPAGPAPRMREIGRASCRGRV